MENFQVVLKACMNWDQQGLFNFFQTVFTCSTWPLLLLLLGCWVLSGSWWPCVLQHARLRCPPLSPRICSNSCPLSWWCYLTIASSASPFFFCLQSFPASKSFPINQLCKSGDQSFVSSATVFPMNIQYWSPLELTGLISLQSKELSRLFSSNTI